MPRPPKPRFFEAAAPLWELLKTPVGFSAVFYIKTRVLAKLGTVHAIY
jgi:hypothetical protein